MEWQADCSRSRHEKIADRQLPDVLGKQMPLLEDQRMARFFRISRHGGDDHDCQADPEQDEEAAEVAVLALFVEVRYARCIFDGRE